MKIWAIKGAEAWTLAVLLAAAVWLAPGAVVGNVPGLYNTGVDDKGEPLPAGQIDRNYRLVSAPPGSGYGPTAYRLRGHSAMEPWPTEGPWLANSSSDLSRWISPAPENPGNWFPPGDYDYETTFDLTGADLSKVRIEGRWASDGGGSATGIRINGTLVPGSSSGGFSGFTPFVVQSGFINGVNRLTFRVRNPGTTNSASGVRVEMNGLPVARSSFPFFSSLGDGFDEPLNRMWRIYGAVNDGTDAVVKFGNEPAFFEWMARKLMWSDEETYRQGLLTRIRHYPMSANGYVWSWSNRPDWPTSPGALHQENNAKYILSLYRYFVWTRDPAFLQLKDTTTTTADSASSYPAADISNGMTVLQKMRLAMQYQLEDLGGKGGLLVIRNGHNTGLPNGAPTNYWDNFPFGYKDAYTNAYFYASVLAMAEIEEFLGETVEAENYRQLARTVWRRYTEEFWDLRKGRFVGTIDVNGRVWDLGFTFLNTEALVYGLGDQTLAESIYSWMDGSRTIATDTSRGADIYRFRWAPRATTVDVASLGTPYWWKSINNQITVGPGGSATYGEHLENGGAIFYTSHYDLLARARYLGADNAWQRLGVIMEEFAVDELRRNPRNNVGAQWKFGIIGVFPESGLVPASYLYAFLGIDADIRGLNIRPNLPAALEHGGVHGLSFGGGKYSVLVQRDRVQIDATASGQRRLMGVVGDMTPGAAYREVVRNLATGTEVVTPRTVSEAGEIPFDLTVTQGLRMTVEPAVE